HGGSALQLGALLAHYRHLAHRRALALLAPVGVELADLRVLRESLADLDVELLPHDESILRIRGRAQRELLALGRRAGAVPAQDVVAAARAADRHAARVDGL